MSIRSWVDVEVLAAWCSWARRAFGTEGCWEFGMQIRLASMDGSLTPSVL